MAGSLDSKLTSGTRPRALLALFLLVALVATACGGVTATETSTGNNDTAKVADDAMAASDAAASAIGSDASADAERTTDSALGQVLAFALSASEDQSYSFRQGMAMKVSAGGFDLDIAPEGAYVTGEVDGSDIHVVTDMGVIMTATFESLGIDVEDPLFGPMLAGFDDASIEMWVDDETVVLDMSDFAGLQAGLGQGAGDLDVFAQGPVKLDLEALDGVSSTAVLNQYGQGAQVSDPALILEALRAVNAVTEVGTDSVDGRNVRVFDATMPMAEYVQALGIDLNDQLAMAELDQFNEDDAAMASAMLPVIDALLVNLIVMVDDDDLVRRIEVDLDFGEMFTAMLDSPEILEAMAEDEGTSVDDLRDEMDEVLGGGFDMSISTWQEFDNYGADFSIVAPDAVDVTAELAADLGG